MQIDICPEDVFDRMTMTLLHLKSPQLRTLCHIFRSLQPLKILLVLFIEWGQSDYRVLLLFVRFVMVDEVVRCR